MSIGGEFDREGEFPTPKYMDFKSSAEAERFYRYDPPFLQRCLRLWTAIFVSRLNILLLPLAAVVLLLFALMPLVYRWRIQPNIYRWYVKLHAFDPGRHKAEGTEHLQAYPVGRKEIEEKVSRISVPLSYSVKLYHLRMHIDMLRCKLVQMIENDDQPF